MYSILYVDDEPGLLEIAKIFLEQDKDFSVDIDTSAEHALGPIGARSYDAIISDYQMPGMDGIAFLKAVRERFGDIPFILFTGRGREEVVIEAINNGADFYLQKGGDPRAQFVELAHKVRQAVARKRAEHSLVESEKRLTDIINFLPDATFAIDRAGTVIAWNRAIEEMTGVPAGEMVGKGAFAYAVPFYGTRRKILIDLIFEPDEVVAKNYANIQREKDVLIAETNLPRPMGKVVRLAGKASPLYDRQGKIVGAIESIRDVTQHERDAEQIAQKTSALSIINRIIQASSLRQTLGEYTKNVLSLTLDLLHYDAGGVYLVEDDRKIARIVSTENLSPEFIRTVDNIDIHAAPYDTLFIRGEPVILENLATVIPEAAKISGFHAIASIPIVAQDAVIGALNVASSESSLISMADREVLLAVGKELGTAITRLKAELALRESEEKYRTLIETTGTGFVIIDGQGTVIDANREYARMTGHASPAEIVGRSVIGWTADYDQERNAGAVRQCMQDGYLRNFEVDYRSPTGTITPVEVNATVFSSHESVQILTLCRDISERKRSRDQVRESEEKYRRILENMQDAYIRVDENGIIAMVNPAAPRMYGYGSADEMIGLPATALYVNAGQEREETIRKLRDAGGITDFSGNAPRKDGTTFGVSLNLQFVRDEEGRIKGTEAIVRDITERKKAEEELKAANEQITASEEELHSQYEELAMNERLLRESQERLRNFMDSATDAFTIWDVDLNLVDLNQVALSYLPQGMRKEDIIGKNFSAFISGTDEWGLYDRYREVIRTGIPFTGTEKLPDPQFGNHWLDVRCFRVGTGLGIVTTDITRQKEAEEELRAAYEQITASEEELRGQLEELITTQEKLRQSERQLAEIADTVPGVVYQFYARPDGSMGFYYVSSRALDIFGIAPDPETFFDRFTENTHPRDRDRFLGTIRTAIMSGNPWDFEGRYIKPEGTRIWFQGNSRPVEREREVVYNGVLLDITARKNAEEARRVSEDRYRSVVENSPYGMHFYELVAGKSLVFAGANPSADRILKVAHDRFIGKTIEEAFPGLAGTEIPERYQEVVKSGTVWQTEQVSYDEGTIGGAYAVTAFRIAPGSMAAMFVDITERKRMEEALFNSQQMLQIVLDSVPQRVFWKDRNSVFLGCNKSLALDAGFSDPAELVGKTDYDHASREVADLYRTDDRAVVESGKPRINYEEPQIRADGSRAWLRTSKIPLRNKEGSIIGVLGTYEDITDEKAAQEQLKESEERYRSLVESSFDGIAIHQDGVLVFVNSTAARLLGYDDPSSLIGKPALEIVHPNERARIAARMAESPEKPLELVHERLQRADGGYIQADVATTPCLWQGRPAVYVTFRDISRQIIAEEALEKRLVALTRPLEDRNIAFEIDDLFDTGELQRLQDEFAKATGVAVLLTRPDGTPITKPSNFCRLCSEIVRGTREGRERCYRSDSELGGFHGSNGPYIHTCLSAGLWGAGANIVVGDRHIANWLIGQVRNETQTEDDMRNYARELGVDEEEYIRAFLEVPVMSTGQFADVAQALSTLANLLSRLAYQNVQQARFITERERAEEALRQKTEELDQYFMASLDLFCIADTGGFFRRLNPEWEKTLGYTIDELEGRRFLDFVHPDDLPGTLAAVADLTDQKSVINFTNRYRHKDGSYRWIEWRSFPKGDLIFAAARDITERKRIEEQLRESEERLRLFIRHAPAALAMFNTDMRYLTASRRWIADYHLEDRDIIGHSHYEIFPEITEDLKAVHRRALGGEVVSADEEKFVREDGSVQWLSWEVRPWYTVGNTIGGIIIFSEDITPRKNAEEQVRQTRDALRTFVDHSYDAILIHDTNGRVIDVNATMLAMYRVTREQALSLTIDDLSGPASRMKIEETQKIWNEVLAGKDQIFPWQAMRPSDGSLFDVEVYLTRIEIEGRPIILGNVRDITRRKQAEEALRESEEKYRMLAERASEGITILQGGIHVYANASMAELLGKPVSDILGRDFLETIWPDDREMLRTRYQDRCAGKPVPETYDFRMIGPGGNPRWVYVSIAKILWQGRPATLNLITDITERKLAEAALQESESNYRNLVENSQSIIYTLLPDGTFTFVSPSWKKVLGHEVSEVVGRNFRHFVHPDDIPLCEGFLKKIIETRDVQTSVGDYRIYHKDGSIHWHRSSVMPVYDGEGTLVSLVGNAIDVTTRKHAEEALLESRAELASILHGLPVLQFVIDRNHRVVSWNKALEEYTGLSAADVVGTDLQWRPFYREKRPVLADLLVDNNADGLFKWYSGKLKPSHYVEGAYEATDFFQSVGASGSWLAFTAAPVRNAEGEIIGAVETLEDVTERIHAEAALRKSEEKYRRILENMQDAYIRTDENGIITMVNPSAVRMYGYDSVGEMIGIPVASLYMRNELQREELLRKLREAGGITDFSGEAVRKDGTIFWVSVNAQFFMDSEGTVRGTEGIVRDITERKVMERAVQEANRKLALLGSITRHDVANKVAIIAGYAQAARMEKLAPKTGEYLKKIEAAGADISRQIAFTKTYQELGVHAPAWCSIPDLVGRQKAEGVAITCTCHAEVYADPMLEKVFQNLVDNAVRHGGHVTKVAVRCKVGHDGLILTVADNGIGVTEDLKEKIFERGFGKHTGFGLFLAREILAITGITIRETGTPGKGARFEMVVPEGGYRGVAEK